MCVLTEIPEYEIHTPKGKVTVNPAFDTVLEIQRLYREKEITDLEKVNQALHMLVADEKVLNLLTILEKKKLLEVITQKHISIRKRHQPKSNGAPVLDFEEDGDYIFASFMQDYQIDLIEEQGKLPWKKFMYLFNGLSEQTKIRQVMRIRSMDIPQYNGKNGKQIQEIQDLKSYYALPVKGNGGKNGLDLLFSTLEGMTK